MNSADLKIYKERLLLLRSRLRNDVTSMTDAALHADGSESSTMPIHMAELGSDNFEQEFTLSLLATEEDTLGMIESALGRVGNGIYGTCEECHGSIPKARLNALPHTSVCVKCAATRDAREMAG